MPTQKEVRDALHANSVAISQHARSFAGYDRAVAHLAYMKELYQNKVIPQSLYHSYKARTAAYRGGLCKLATSAKGKIHTTWKAYDTLRNEYAKLHHNEQVLIDTLRNLTKEQKELLRQHFCSN